MPPERRWQLDGVAQHVRAEERSITSLRTDQFELLGCRQVMAQIGRQSIDGIGFALLDRHSLERDGVPAKQAIVWLEG